MAGTFPQNAYAVSGNQVPTFSSYAGPQMFSDPRILGPQNHLDGVAFWYRPDPAMPAIEQHEIIHAPQSAAESVKHRRTRSGCFTCRTRRVKCDEARPICDRCRKGNRVCEFPQQPSSSKSSGRTKGARNHHTVADDAGSSEGEGEEKPTLETIKDEGEDQGKDYDLSPARKPVASPGSARSQHTQHLSRKQKHRQRSESNSAKKEKARSPSVESSTSEMSGTQTPATSLNTQPSSTRTTPKLRAKWAHLRKDLQKFLEFHYENMTSFHYFIKFDVPHFFQSRLIDIALTYDPLLYAVVGFSAYHYTFTLPEGRISNFLGYYSRSLTLLMKSIKDGEPHTEARILTILQLATFEEHLGDWPNLIGHHRAARQALQELFTVETIMETDLGRQIMSWFARFDVIAGLLAGNEGTIPREWYAQCERWYADHIDPEDVDIEYSLLYFSATNRLLGLDMAALFSKLPRGLITPAEFMAENEIIGQKLDALRERIESINDGYYTVDEFPERRPLDPGDIVDPYVPGGLYKDALFPLNYSWLDWYGTEMMRKYQSAAMLQRPPPQHELETIALEQCRIYETIERWPHSPKGSALGAMASIGISILFLPKDDRHTWWSRRKLAAIEQMGFVYPKTFRSRMADIWRLPECNEWWLPNDEGFTPLLREIRAFIRERAAAYEASTGDDIKDDLRDMKAIFSKLNIDDNSPRSSPSDPTGRTP